MKTLYDDGNCWLGLDYLEDLPFLHVKIESFSPSKYKEYLVEFNKVLLDNNLKQVYSVCTTEKAKKFNEIFGFTYVCPIDQGSVMEYSL